LKKWPTGLACHQSGQPTASAKPLAITTPSAAAHPRRPHHQLRIGAVAELGADQVPQLGPFERLAVQGSGAPLTRPGKSGLVCSRRAGYDVAGTPSQRISPGGGAQAAVSRTRQPSSRDIRSADWTVAASTARPPNSHGCVLCTDGAQVASATTRLATSAVVNEEFMASADPQLRAGFRCEGPVRGGTLVPIRTQAAFRGSDRNGEMEARHYLRADADLMLAAA
jgi:hypothetical protein